MRRMRCLPALGLLFCATAAHAAITGSVTNQSTGKPQPGATVALYKLGTATGLELIDQAKSDAQGNFSINQTPQGPHLIRTAFDGVTYNHMLPPGQPTSGIALEVYNSSTQPGDAKVSKHMLLFEPTAGQLSVSETFLFTNQGKTAWNDPDKGTLKFFLPAGASKPEVRATAPGGMPLGTPVIKTAKPDIFAADFAVKPGETRFDITFTVPYKEGTDYEGKIVTKDDNTYLIVPSGIGMKGKTPLNDLGVEPRTQAHIMGLTGTSYKIQFTGAVAAAPAPTGAPDEQASEDGPRIEQIMPRINGRAVPILCAALGILALGFVLLYRARGPQA
jgi:hypothetical protein